MAYSADSFTAGEVPTTAKWNKLWNNDADFDARLVQAAPVGEVSSFAGSSAPTGWLLCDGSAVSRTTYAALFAIIGTTYGVGNGSTTFNLPNLKGRVIVGRDSAQTEFDVLGETQGAKDVTHEHFTQTSSTQDGAAAVQNGASTTTRIVGRAFRHYGAGTQYSDNIVERSTYPTTISVLQPGLVLNAIIKT